MGKKEKPKKGKEKPAKEDPKKKEAEAKAKAEAEAKAKAEAEAKAKAEVSDASLAFSVIKFSFSTTNHVTTASFECSPPADMPNPWASVFQRRCAKPVMQAPLQHSPYIQSCQHCSD